MRTAILTEHIPYTGEQLNSRFAYERGAPGPSIVAFIGPARVKENLVDLEDQNTFISSPSMLHFIITLPNEHDLEKVVFVQRLFMAVLADALKVTRRGDDLYFGDRKLSVSIATLSPIHGLIHIGLNVREAPEAPVRTCGLCELPSVGDTFDKNFIRKLLDLMADEYLSCITATVKVKPVG